MKKGQQGGIVGFIIVTSMTLIFATALLPLPIGSWHTEVVSNSTVVGSYESVFALLPIFVIIGMLVILFAWFSGKIDLF